jgi:hypothetical protein
MYTTWTFKLFDCPVRHGVIILLIKYQISCSVGGYTVIVMAFVTDNYTVVVSCVTFLFMIFVSQLWGKLRELVHNYTHKEEYAYLCGKKWLSRWRNPCTRLLKSLSFRILRVVDTYLNVWNLHVCIYIALKCYRRISSIYVWKMLEWILHIMVMLVCLMSTL